MKIVTNANIKYKGERYKINEEVSIDKNDLKELKTAGVVEEVIEEDDDISEDGKDIDEMNLDELKDYAKKLEMTGYSKLSKDELVEAIKEKLEK